ncbi:ABC transporter ATP-binding protein [Rathayibacter toxicus]|uniref:ABC transporter ATP-binding protein n=1 Tax=Rathayibacter toxicus TaxID=145458 RepID=UPI001C059781|nr:ABC transporter ATP-binding protein [Rathayibacter toxicus]QWL31848.1 ABC transporter ATP-binding protein [Rathayibacter toxicus]QWL33941.1 ABC transporter ATP-binding protein [Rathayibacter toxicus]QWL36073.1 ABC transporter ATP-binding protein [Rathayibacter toxicus]QWL38164.1 ABC transporter ATP-binding protein [Rathayibacter toxicus]QWL40253.1 ABC transporter ATP-binding protein [Rathayibacter toxicus]
MTLTSKSDSPTTSAPNPTIVRVKGASKRFVIRKDKSFKERIVNFGRGRQHRDEFWALREINIEIPLGSTVGLIGANGSGKSTLLKLIGGIVQPTDGTVERRGRLAALLELGAGFHPDLTGRENIYLNGAILGLSRNELDEKFDSIVNFSEIVDFIDTQVKFYSSGMYVRLAFAIAIHTDPDLLLVDEVLAVGDEPFQRKCMDRIRAFQRAGKTIVLVTHSLEQVGELCDRTIVLEKGSLVFDGETSEGLQVLRESFEDRRAALHEREAATDAHTSAPKPIEILSCALRGGSIEHGSIVVRSGESLEFDVTVRTNRPIDDWNVGMGIDTPLGQRVFGTNTERIGTPLKPVDGEMTITFTLPDVHLGPGNYAVHASAATFSQGETMRIPVAATFTVERSSVHEGVVDIDSSVRLSVQ